MLLLGAGLASAQAQKAGVFVIDKINEKGKFDRCALTLEPGPNMLRIAWNANHDYAMSVPTGPKSPGPLLMRVDLGKAGTFSAAAPAAPRP